MRIERINENEVKIIITPEDLVERNIAIESLSFNSKEARELFWDLMKRAETELGFDTQDAQLCVEAIPDEAEGFVITITKMEEEIEESFESIQKYIKSKYKKSDLRAKKKNKRISSTVTMYHFESIDNLKALAKRIVNYYDGDSIIYKYKNSYYLILLKNRWNNKDSMDTILSEYGFKVSEPNIFEGVLEEYGIKISSTSGLEIVLNYY